MAVASPYAVFRAVDLGWPLAMPVLKAEPVEASHTTAELEPAAGRSTPTKRRYGGGLRRRSAPQWNTLIQGELFPA